MSKTFSSYVHFFLAGLTRRQTGAVVPSQRFLISKMLKPIPEDYTGQIVELGAGNGALTVELASRCPNARILACEINPVLAQDSRENLARAGINGRVRVVQDAAENVLEKIASNGKADYILSGIPLGNLDRGKTLNLIDAIGRALVPGGLYVQFQHSLMDRRKIQQRFGEVSTVPVLLNFPPAFVYYARA